VDRKRIQPVGGDHAIEVMAIGVEWATPLDDAQLQALQAVYTESLELKGSFPQFAPTQAFLIQGAHHFDFTGSDPKLRPAPEDATQPQFVTKAAGFDVRQAESDGRISWVISVRPEFLSCNCSAYDRWKNVKPKALAALRPFIDAALRLGAQINAVGLQYQDAFRLLDGASPETSKQLFRRDSRWISSHLFDESSFWHCHQGWFSEGADARRVLNNVTTDLSEVNGVHFARIGGQHRIFAVSADGQTQIKMDAIDVEAVLECLHEENKMVINGILSDGALDAIGCSVGGE
jgi:uncharacterized protein (TIGR04255 family)